MPPGWYRKPTDRRQHGYWDGLAWVEPAVQRPEAEQPPNGHPESSKSVPGSASEDSH